MKVEIRCSGNMDVPLGSLIEFQGNLKSLSKENYAKLKKEILELGFSEPFAVWQSPRGRLLLNGHQRIRTLKAMADEGYELPDKFPISLVTAKDEAEAKKKVLALASQYGTVESQGLYEFMHEAGIDLDELTQSFEFPEIDFREFTSEFFEEEAKEDEVPEAPKVPITKPGDLWALGNHRLWCGDCVVALPGIERDHFALTDPPYGIKRDKGFDGFVGFGGFGPPIARRTYDDDWDSDRPKKEVFDLILAKADVAIIFGGNFFADILPQGTHWIVWDKKNTMPTFGDAELAWTNVNRTSVKIFERQYNGLIGKEKERHHPTQKPINLFMDILAAYGDDKRTVLDPFAGSGTTLIAAEQLNRRCYAIEIEPKYCDVIIQRWENLTGGKAKRVQSA